MSDNAVLGRSIQVRGIVQGVGFRPFVFRLAKTYSLALWVRNDDGGVDIQVDGAGTDIEGFLREMSAAPAPACDFASLSVNTCAPQGLQVFRMAESPAGTRAAELLRLGGVVAVKGIGGSHLCRDAGNPAAVRALRERKFRKGRKWRRLFERPSGRLLKGCLRLRGCCVRNTASTLSFFPGGVFQNSLLLFDVNAFFDRSSAQVWVNSAVPPNHGGISLGQAAMAAFHA